MRIRNHADAPGLTGAQRNYSARRIGRESFRLQDAIRGIEAHVADEIGPDRSLDKRCRVHSVCNLPTVVIVRHAGRAPCLVAVGRVLADARRSLEGHLERTQWVGH